MSTLEEEAPAIFDRHLVILWIMQRLTRRRERSSKFSWMQSRRNNRILIMLEEVVQVISEARARSVPTIEAGAV